MNLGKKPGRFPGHKNVLDLRNADVGDAYMAMQQICDDGRRQGLTPAQIAQTIELALPGGQERWGQKAWDVAKKEIYADYRLPSPSARNRNP